MAKTAPNIVLIMADQLAPQFTGAYGHPVVKTPHMDRLATVACDLMPPIVMHRFVRHRASASCRGS